MHLAECCGLGAGRVAPASWEVCGRGPQAPTVVAPAPDRRLLLRGAVRGQ